MEKDFFITEYIGDSRSEIKCILKQRYSDFIVNEITPQEVITGKLYPFFVLFCS